MDARSEWHARRQRKSQRSQKQRDKWVEFENRDQHDEADDSHQRRDQQIKAMRIDHRLCGESRFDVDELRSLRNFAAKAYWPEDL